MSLTLYTVPITTQWPNIDPQQFHSSTALATRLLLSLNPAVHFYMAHVVLILYCQLIGDAQYYVDPSC